jgi:hypothetical protein
MPKYRGDLEEEGFIVSPSGIEVYEPEAGEGVEFVFGFGVRGPAEGGEAGPRVAEKMRKSKGELTGDVDAAEVSA